jgi:hypothetical protein
MTALAITDVGVATAGGATGVSALAAIATWAGAPSRPERPAAEPVASIAIRRRTGLRYLDPVVELGAVALDSMSRDAPSLTSPDCDDFRTGILAATRLGPSSTRQQLYRSLAERRTVSGTLFSNCGYNVAGAVLAKLAGARGPGLTIAAQRGWSERLFRLAGSFFARGQADRFYLSHADGDLAIVLCVEPARGLDPPGDRRQMIVASLAGDPLGADGRVRAPEGAAATRVQIRATPVRLVGETPAWNDDLTFLRLAWWWLASEPSWCGALHVSLE